MKQVSANTAPLLGNHSMENSFVTLGLFIIDEFTFMDEDGRPTGRYLAPQIGGGGTYAAIGARIWYAQIDVIGSGQEHCLLQPGLGCPQVKLG